MPIQFPDFQRISYDEANPFFKGMEQGQRLSQGFMQFPQDLQSKILANQIAQVQAKYAEPNAAASLKTAQQHNQYDPRVWESEIGLRGAQAGLAGSEASKNKFLMQNPQYISPEGMLISQAIAAQKQQQAQASQQPQPQQGGGEQAGGGQPPMQGQPGQGAVPFSGGGQQSSSRQLPQPQGAQYSPNQYSPDALAFNPPSLPSPTGNPNLDNLYFKKFGMSPIMQTQLDLSKAQAEKYQQQNIERNKEFNNQSVFANESTLNAHKFLDALDRSTALERGYAGGNSPAISNAAQEMEAASNAIAASNAQLFQGGNAVHQSDIELAHMSKANRKQNKEVSFDLAQGTIAKNDRMKDKQLFYAQGTQLGLKPEIMDAMWNKFETERPYFNTETHMPNDAYKGTWRDYLHPEVVNEFLRGKDFNLPNQRQLQNANWSKKDLNQIQTWAKKNNLDPKDFSKMNLYRLAKNENISLSQLKQELRARGAI